MNPKILLKPIGNKDLPVKLGEKILDKPNVIEISTEGEKLIFSFGVGGNVQVELFNDINDFDPERPDEVIGGTGSLIEFDPKKTWLKYSANVGIKTKSGIDVEKLGFKFSGKREVKSSAYRKHGLSEKLGEALRLDAKNFKSIFSAEQVRLLESGEAVTYSMAGEFKASAKFTWSDILSSSLSFLGQLLNQNTLFKIKIGAEATASFVIKIEDSFNVRIVRKDNNALGIYITKSKSNSKSGAVGLKVGAELENEEGIERILSTLVQGFFDESEKRIEEVLAKASDNLANPDKEMISAIAERLGWTKEADLFKKLKEEYGVLKSSLREKVKALAESKVSAGFAYDYQRLDTHSLLFEAEISDVGIDKFHPDILKMNINPLVLSVQRKERYLSNALILQKDVLEVTRATGFSIGFGEWQAASKKKIEVKMVAQENEQGFRKINYQGKRSYWEKAGGDGVQWKIDLDAGMKAFSQNAVPYANEFDCGLYLGITWREAKLDLYEITRFTDQAAVWGILNESDVDGEASRILAGIGAASDAILCCEIKIDPSTLKAMLPALARSCRSDDVFSLSLGKAMPRWGDYAIRSNIALRGQYYGSLWKSYLSEKEDPEPNIQLYADGAYHLLRSVDPELAVAERDYRSGTTKPEAYSFILNANPGTYLNRERLATGFEDLAKGYDSRSMLSYDKVIPKAFDCIEDFWRHPHHFRALGVLLAMVADGYPVLRKNIERSASVSYTDPAGKKMVVIIEKV